MKSPSLDSVEAAQLLDRLERLSRGAEAQTGLNPAQWEALRYVARANRFSRTPAALADYLGSTRGTVSQTLIALEDKGLITRTPSTADRRSLDLQLTAGGVEALERDPLLGLARDLDRGAASDVRALVQMLRSTLHATVQRNGGRAFGACYSCLHFRRDAHASEFQPHHCALLDQSLSEADSNAICHEQAPVGT